MDVPAAVLSVVLLEMAVGGLAILWLVPTWGHVRHGYEILLGGSLALMALAAWGAMRAPIAAADAPAAALVWLGRGLAATAIVALASTVLLAVRAHLAGRVAGFLATAVGIATFVPLAQVRASAPGTAAVVLALTELVLGAFFVGAVWDAMILGHWYLVERRLSNRYMVWIAWINVAAVAAGVTSVALSGRHPVPCSGATGADLQVCALTYSPILSIGSFTIIMGAGLVALVALTAAFNVKLAREGGRSIQAATGMSYLAVILAPAAEFAAKVRFF